jgi:DNA topoisomerase-2
MPYTAFLEGLLDGGVDKKGKKMAPSIRDFTSVCTEVNVDFTVVFPQGKLSELEASQDTNGCNGVEKLLKLFTTISTTNMHMFNAECKLHKYNDVNEIIDDFFGVRMDLYQKRKDYLVKDMERKLMRLSNRAKYIQENLAGTIDLRRKKSDEVNAMLESKKYDKLDGDYKYLIKMPMDSVTQENVEQIMKEKANTETELNVLKKTTLEKMWLSELDTLKLEYGKYKLKREKIQAGEIVKQGKKVTKTKVVRKKK